MKEKGLLLEEVEGRPLRKAKGNHGLMASHGKSPKASRSMIGKIVDYVLNRPTEGARLPEMDNALFRQQLVLDQAERQQLMDQLYVTNHATTNFVKKEMKTGPRTHAVEKDKPETFQKPPAPSKNIVSSANQAIK